MATHISVTGGERRKIKHEIEDNAAAFEENLRTLLGDAAAKLDELERCRIFKSLKRLVKHRDDVEKMSMAGFERYINPDYSAGGIPARM